MNYYSNNHFNLLSGTDKNSGLTDLFTNGHSKIVNWSDNKRPPSIWNRQQQNVALNEIEL